MDDARRDGRREMDEPEDDAALPGHLRYARGLLRKAARNGASFVDIPADVLKYLVENRRKLADRVRWAEERASSVRPAPEWEPIISKGVAMKEQVIEIDEDGKVHGNDLESAVASSLNRFSAENASNTPDWILAQYLLGCLAAWNTAVQQRETWYGRDASPTSPPLDAAPQRKDLTL